MATTGQIGGPDSDLGNIVLGEGAAPGTGGTVTKELDAVWNVRAKVNTTFEVQWSISDSAGVSLEAQWNVEGPFPGVIGKSLQAQWSVQAKATKTLVAQWGVQVQPVGGIPPVPEVFVEIAFSSNPGDETPIWTDVTSYARAIHTKRGREEELDNFSAGTASIVLDNSDRRFDPSNAASPYFPNVVPMRRVRISAQFVEYTKDLFTGFVERWPVEWHDPEDSIVTLELVDAFAVLAASDLPTAWELDFPVDHPVLWWRLGEISGSQVAMDSAAGRLYDGSYFGGPNLGQSSLLPYNTDSAATFDAAQNQYVLHPNVPVNSSFSVEFWIKAPTPPDFLATVLQVQIPGSEVRIMGDNGLLPDGSGLSFRVLPSTSDVYSTVPVFDDKLHHVVATLAGSTQRLYVDGVEVGFTFGDYVAPTVTSGTGELMLGGVYRQGTFTGTLDEFALYDYALTSTQVTDHNSLGRRPWLNDNSGTRVTRILDAVDWPMADRLIDSGQSLLQAASLGDTALGHLQAVDDTENGQLFVTASGLIQFRSRHAVITYPTSRYSQATFGDVDPQLPYEQLVPEYSVEKVRNEIRVSSQGQSTQVAIDEASQTKYLKRTYEHSGSLAVIASELRDEADSLLARYKEPKLRFRSMTVRALNNRYIWDPILILEIGDRITVGKTPPGGGAAISAEVLIEGIEHSIQPGGDWVTTWKLSQEMTQTYWIWDESVWDESTRWAY